MRTPEICKKRLIVEEGDPVVEEQVRSLVGTTGISVKIGERRCRRYQMTRLSYGLIESVG